MPEKAMAVIFQQALKMTALFSRTNGDEGLELLIP